MVKTEINTEERYNSNLILSYLILLKIIFLFTLLTTNELKRGCYSGPILIYKQKLTRQGELIGTLWEKDQVILNPTTSKTRNLDKNLIYSLEFGKSGLYNLAK